MITHAQLQRLKALIHHHVTSAIEATWAGTNSPGEAESLREGAKTDKRTLDAFLKEITEKP